MKIKPRISRVQMKKKTGNSRVQMKEKNSWEFSSQKEDKT